MKTKTKNSSNACIAQKKTINSSFPKKVFVLMSVLLLSIGFQAKGQTSYWWVEANNINANCDFTVTAYDASSNILFQFPANRTPSYNSGGSCTTTVVASIVVTRPLCSPITFTPTLGVFLPQQASNCCSGNVYCDEYSYATCGAPPSIVTHHIIINID